MRWKYLQAGGDLVACGTCLDSRDLVAGELRPRGTTGDLLGLIEGADQVVTVG